MKALIFLLVLSVILLVCFFISYIVITPKVRKTKKEEEPNQIFRKTFSNNKLAYILNRLVWRAYRELEESYRCISIDDNNGYFWIVDGVKIYEDKMYSLKANISSLTICSSLKNKKSTLEKLDIPNELLISSRHWRALNDIRFQILDDLTVKN